MKSFPSPPAMTSSPEPPSKTSNAGPPSSRSAPGPPRRTLPFHPDRPRRKAQGGWGSLRDGRSPAWPTVGAPLGRRSTVGSERPESPVRDPGGAVAGLGVRIDAEDLTKTVGSGVAVLQQV